MPGSYTATKYSKKQIKDLIGFRPGNLSVYQQALIPKSSVSVTENSGNNHNERLEYLGDAILEAVITDMLYREFPHQSEGFLTKIRAKLVNRDNLNSVGKDLQLLLFIEPPAYQNQHKRDLLGNTVEALIGAVYLDKGFRSVRKFVFRILIKNLHELHLLIHKETDYKSQIVELAQKNKLEICFKTSHMTEDSKNSGHFSSSISLETKTIGQGEGPSKKEAEQNAAREALLTIHKDQEIPGNTGQKSGKDQPERF